MSVMSGQGEATHKPEPAVMRQGAENGMLMEKGMLSPTMLIGLCQTNEVSTSTPTCLCVEV